MSWSNHHMYVLLHLYMEGFNLPSDKLTFSYEIFFFFVVGSMLSPSVFRVDSLPAVIEQQISHSIVMYPGYWYATDTAK